MTQTPSGILVVDKPAGPTSHDIVGRVRRALRTKKVGHTGTLDPAATGVLPILIGSATKLSRYLMSDVKAYEGIIRLGIDTDTLDAQGQVLSERPVDVSAQEVAQAVATLVGDIQQVPPMYSAKKQDGKKLYELARKGVEVKREPKAVTVQRFDTQNDQLPEIPFEVVCSAGTYVRVLAQDLGNALGCGGHLKTLRRTRAGSFDLSDAVTLEALEESPDACLDKMVPVSAALQHIPKVEIPRDVGKKLGLGYQLTVAELRTVDVPNLSPDDLVAVTTSHGDLVAIARSLVHTDNLGAYRRDDQGLKTERVLATN